MAKKEKSDGIEFLFFIPALPIAILYIINAIATYRHFTKKYPLVTGDTRITDANSFIAFSGRLFICCYGLVLFLLMTAATFRDDYYILSILALSFLIMLFITGITESARMGISQIGMLIFPARGKFVIPADPAKNTFTENYIQLKYLNDMYSMEELNLNDIKKITRESGKKVFVHGAFGTRCIKWRNKQKRDECIAALERECKRRLSSFDAGY